MNGEIILIVEDNDSLRSGISEMLTLEGFSVLSASNGVEAIELLKSNLPELILSDVMMPEMDGFDFYSEVRAQPELFSTPFLFLTARTDPEDALKGRTLGADDYLTKPISRDELVTTIRSRLNRSRQVKLAQIEQAYVASMTLLAGAIEARTLISNNHIERVTETCQLLASYLGWSERSLPALRFAAILHDIGKLHIPDRILLKEIPLSESDWVEIKRHTLTGVEMIRGIPLLAEAIPIIRHHHENWDGNGYPDGLAGLAIPPGARMLGVVDSFDTMVSPRVYARQLSASEALDELERLAGSRYDRTYVQALRAVWQEGKLQKIYPEKV
jgi:putative two-component system response regulator